VGANGGVNKTRRGEILDAAERLFRDKGYLATTMRDIAAETKLQGGGSLYAHIKGKEDLLWEIATEAIDAFFAAVTPITEQALPADQKLREAIIAHIEVISTRLSAAAVYFDEWRHLTQPRRDQFLARRDEYEYLFDALIHDGLRTGVFAVPDQKLATLHVLGAMNAVRHWYKPDGRLTAHQMGEGIATMLLAGLQRR
jgi:TetR/AcrR family transcriptional regulator, cholesterol catabolism regulator